jgi:hypothetical protein
MSINGLLLMLFMVNDGLEEAVEMLGLTVIMLLERLESSG